MTLKLKIIAIVFGIILLIYVVELVRRRKLREEYSWLWLVTGFTIVVLTVWYDLLLKLSEMLDGVWPSAILFLCGLIFLLLIGIDQSVRISKLTNQVKMLSQELALLQAKSINDGKEP